MSTEIDEVAILGKKIVVEDRDFFSYTRCGDYIAKRVAVCNTGEPIEVTFVEATGSFNQYAESLSVAGLSTTTILSYTVPASSTYKLKRADVSGDNRAVCIIEVNGSTQAKKRIYYTKFNTAFEFADISYSEGDIIKVIVENKSTTTADFNVNLQGTLKNA
jgi:hypothetical protein